MSLSQIKTILLPTDFSEPSVGAFAHGLKLALAMNAELDLFHVEPGNDQTDWHWAPTAVGMLKRWGVLAEGDGEEAAMKLGISARRSSVGGVAADQAILQEMANAHADLVVMATHGRSGLERWTRPSVSEPVVTKGSVPVLLLPAHTPGFVDPVTGSVTLRRILIPIDHQPDPSAAFAAASMMGRALGGDELEIATLHCGTRHPATDKLEVAETWKVHHWDKAGDAVDTILATAESWVPDLVVLVTEGRTSFLDNVRGSTVDRLRARCRAPMLILPTKKG